MAVIPELDDTPTLALLDARYQLIQRVGEGGMAQVFRAEDIVLGRTVAIKLMRTDADVLASSTRARGEVKALARLSHPALVTLLDASVEPGRARYLVMEYVEGPTLAARLRDGALSTAEVAHLAAELAAGLHAVHAAGLLHRDVKPSNVLLAPATGPTAPFHVKLTDFGLAQDLDADSITAPGMVLGTAAYLSPEQVRGEGASPASDIYSFGLLLLEAFTGERPFAHTSGIGAVLARLLESPVVPAHVPPAWARLLTSMTATDPAQRPTALDVAQRVASIVSNPVDEAMDAATRRPATVSAPVAQSVTAALPVDRHIVGSRRRARAARTSHASRVWMERTIAVSGGVAAAVAVAAAVLVGTTSPAVPAVPTVIADGVSLSANPAPLPLRGLDGITVAPREESPVTPVTHTGHASVPAASTTAPSATLPEQVSPVAVTRLEADVTAAQDREARKDTAAQDREARKEAAAQDREARKEAAAQDREVRKQAAAEEREARKQAAADQRAADKAARGAAKP